MILEALKTMNAKNEAKTREMTGFLSTLAPTELRDALAYRGADYHPTDTTAREAVGRPVTGFLATLSPAQQEAAIAYCGDDTHPAVGQLWLDMDGVLADFDTAACAALGTDNTYKWEWIHGTKAFWAGLNANPNFFLDLPPMRDAWFLLESVRHLKPKVLTALPKTGADAVAVQKREWIARHIGDLEVVTCLTHEKPDYCQPGDVLVDDRAVNRSAWEKRGGRYVLHTDALSSVRELREMGVL